MRIMNKQIYFDHAATTDVLPEVRDAMLPYLTDDFGNASASYELGEHAHLVLEEAREKIAHCIGAKPSEIYFTSGGSESDNWAIKNTAGEQKTIGKHVITSKIEHHAILHSCEYLEQLGYEVTYLGVDEQGIIDLQELQESITPQTTLISCMYGNNEIGTLQPIVEIGKIARRNHIYFHTDAVQVVGQLPIDLRQLPVDMLSASAHKFHGPKGVGFLYVRDGVMIPSFIHGGSQEMGKRAGTENVAGIVGMAKALICSVNELPEARRRIRYLRNYLVERVLKEIPDVRYNGHPGLRLPGNANFSFKGIEATTLLVLLEEDGIFASAGSACNTGKSRVSHVIEAIGVPEDYAAGTIRFTLGRENTKEEIDQTIESLKQNVKLLRQFN